jgi:hypothetical protein
LIIASSILMNVKKMTQEVNMNFKAKVAILLLAILVSLAGFSLISAPAVDIMKIGKKARYEIISNVPAKAELASTRSSSM